MSPTSTSSQQQEASSSGGGADGGSGDGVGTNSDGVVWKISTFSTELMNWTVFPSTGLLRPGERFGAHRAF